jgi:antitoxin component of MazEF toxin-antitoxin module
MSTLLEKALEKVVALSQNEQDAIASQILASLADEDAWKKRLAEKRDVIRRMAREALEEDDRGETLSLDNNDGEIVPHPSDPRYELAELVSRITSKNRHRETDWGRPHAQKSKVEPVA